MSNNKNCYSSKTLIFIIKLLKNYIFLSLPIILFNIYCLFKKSNMLLINARKVLYILFWIM